LLAAFGVVEGPMAEAVQGAFEDGWVGEFEAVFHHREASFVEFAARPDGDIPPHVADHIEWADFGRSGVAAEVGKVRGAACFEGLLVDVENGVDKGETIFEGDCFVLEGEDVVGDAI